jgi:hypothetical protein
LQEWSKETKSESNELKIKKVSIDIKAPLNILKAREIKTACSMFVWLCCIVFLFGHALNIEETKHFYENYNNGEYK